MVKNKSKIIKILGALAIVGILAITGTGCSLIGGDSDNSNEKADPIAYDNQADALLGELKKDAPEEVQNNLKYLLDNANGIRDSREKDGKFDITSEEEALWQQITAILDGETILQKGVQEEEFFEGDEEASVEFYESVMKRLSKTLSEEDSEKLRSLTNFNDEELEMTSYSYDEALQLLEKYDSLDAGAVMQNLQYTDGAKNVAIFKLTHGKNTVDIKYLKGSQTGLKDAAEEDVEKYQTIFQDMTKIIPGKYLDGFKYFIVSTDGEFGTGAAVIPIDSVGKDWAIMVDPADWFGYEEVVPYTVVHEFAHYLSLNDKQVEYFGDDVKTFAHDRYADDYLVANEDSYMQKFYKNYWTDLKMDAATIEYNPYFYQRHTNEFITSYAASDPAEDFAETFSAYVFQDPSGLPPRVQEKMDFFNQFPELVQLKKDINKSVKKNNVVVGETIQ